MKGIIIEENSGYDEDTRKEYTCSLTNALIEISKMIEEGYHAGIDCPLGWNWHLKTVEA